MTKGRESKLIFGAVELKQSYTVYILPIYYERLNKEVGDVTYAGAN